MKIAYLHNLPLEYYPPASNFLDLAGQSKEAEVRVFTTHNRKQRKDYEGEAIKITRSNPSDPQAFAPWRLRVALWWHLRTAISLLFFRPEAIIYVEPHSAIAAYLYCRFFRGSARLFIHHHEFYELEDYDRPGMRMPRLGNHLERNYLFQRAVWISQTNSDRLRLARQDNPDISSAVWNILPNYPPQTWAEHATVRLQQAVRSPMRLIYVGAASFEDTYIEEIVRWVAAFPEQVELHVCGYNVAPDVWDWLAKEQFSNVSYDARGYVYEELPTVLENFDIGLVLYKGNTTNFIYNVPNKVFEYLQCGLDVWYPMEMAGIRNFRFQNPGALYELNFADLSEWSPFAYQPPDGGSVTCSSYTAENAFAPLFEALGIEQRAATG
ncbi:hypothetical protein ACFL07_02265 [Pseudomonadota bacterium]